jgi:hypothetical protein
MKARTFLCSPVTDLEKSQQLHYLRINKRYQSSSTDFGRNQTISIIFEKFDQLDKGDENMI